MNIKPFGPSAALKRTAPKPAEPKLPRPDEWDLNLKKGEWEKGHDGLTYRRTMSNVGAAVGGFLSHFAVIGAGAALGASLGAGLGALGWAIGMAGAVGGGLAGAYVGGKLQAKTLWGRSVLTKAGATVGNAVGRAMHALKIPLRSNHVETAQRFSIKSLNKYGADLTHSGHQKISRAQAREMVAKMKPGDIVLTGDNRSTPIATVSQLVTGRSNFSHSLIYKGDGKAIESIMGPGVIESDMEELFAGKHHAVVIRPDYEEGQAEKAVEFSEKLVGKPYDYKFKSGNDTWYCSEAVVAALRESAPQVEFDTRKVLGVKELIVPNDLFYTEDARVVGELGEGRSYLDRLMGKFIEPAQASAPKA